MIKPCCEEARAVYDCPRCGDREYRNSRFYASFVACARNAPGAPPGRLCGETVRTKEHPVLHPDETYSSFRPGFAHLVGFECPEHGWTLREELQPELFPRA